MNQHQYLQNKKRELNKRSKQYDQVKSLRAKIRELESRVDQLEREKNNNWYPYWPYTPWKWADPVWVDTVKIVPIGTGYGTTTATTISISA